MPGAQKIETQRVVKDVEIKVRLSWDECHFLLRLILLAKLAGDCPPTDDSINKYDRDALAFAKDLKTVLEQAMGSEANKQEME